MNGYLFDGLHLLGGSIDHAVAVVLVTINRPVGAAPHLFADADVLLHAISDALLGAAALGDIGKHFPDTDEAFKNADSLILLKKVFLMIKEKGYTVTNIDATIIAQAPKMSPFIETMRKNIADAVCCDISDINVKATTEEHLGFTGEKLGISAHAVCIISKK